jgi:hypothetical protein
MLAQLLRPRRPCLKPLFWWWVAAAMITAKHKQQGYKRAFNVFAARITKIFTGIMHNAFGYK